jgi:competence protein ComEA
MFKKFFAFLAAMSLMAAFAAVDINKGSEAELQSIKGIGAAKSKLIVEERKKGEFKNWEDFIARVKGFGEASATKLSAEGLTVGGAGFKPAAKDSKAAAKDAKPAAAAATPKAEAKPAAAAAAPAAPAAKAEAKPEAPKK